MQYKPDWEQTKQLHRALLRRVGFGHHLEWWSGWVGFELAKVETAGSELGKKSGETVNR